MSNPKIEEAGPANGPADMMNNDTVAREMAERLSTFLPNNRIYRMIVGFVGVTLVISVIGAIALSVWGQVEEIPDILVATASGALGALAGLLVQE